jgi:hypothetical protein
VGVQQMPVERWTWSASAHPRVEGVVSNLSTGLEWCGQLETSAADAVVGKVLCVCAAAALARAVSAVDPVVRPLGAEALALLVSWIDDPSEERFERICSWIFDEREPPDYNPDPHGVIAWALRTATSSVSNFEAGWALETTCGAVVDAGFTMERIRMIVEQELLARKT